jgi:hypothetical protein
MRANQAAGRESHALARVAELMEGGLGLRLLLPHLPPGATLADARTLREHILQRGRQPSRLLDEGLGIERA